MEGPFDAASPAAGFADLFELTEAAPAAVAAKAPATPNCIMSRLDPFVIDFFPINQDYYFVCWRIDFRPPLSLLQDFSTADRL
jgi:hypothetical protein